MKEEWKLFWGYMVVIFLLLLSQCNCTSAPIGSIGTTTYELIEPLGTLHRYRKEPLVGKSYYCLIHKYPEIIYVVEGTKRVRLWTGHDWR